MNKEKIVTGYALIEPKPPIDLPVYSPMYGLPRKNLFIVRLFSSDGMKKQGGTASSIEEAFRIFKIGGPSHGAC